MPLTVGDQLARANRQGRRYAGEIALMVRRVSDAEPDGSVAVALSGDWTPVERQRLVRLNDAGEVATELEEHLYLVLEVRAGEYVIAPALAEFQGDEDDPDVELPTPAAAAEEDADGSVDEGGAPPVDGEDQSANGSGSPDGGQSDTGGSPDGSSPPTASPAP